MRILVIGKNGQIGYELCRTLAPLGVVIPVDVPEINLQDPDSIRESIAAHDPAVVINAAAYTAVDKAEEEGETAMAVNGEAPGIIAEELRRRGGLVVHYSTDYVFDGEGETPFREDSPPAPLSVYGRSKLAGEEAIRNAGAAHLIFRTSWVYGTRGSNFLLTMLRLMAEREEVRVVDDQIGAPTWCRMAAEATAQALLLLLRGATPFTPEECRSTYHLTAAGETSWHGFAAAISELDPNRMHHTMKKLIPIPTESYPAPAPRPRNSRLDCFPLKNDFDIELPHWEFSLRQAMESIPKRC